MEPFDQILRQTLADLRVSRGEKRILENTLRELNPTEHQRAVLRSRAFDIARAELLGPDASKVLEWLEEVNKVLLSGSDASSGEDSEPDGGAWFSPRDDIANRITRMIDRCGQQLDVCVFTITDDRISNGLLDASRRGVKLRIITDNDKSADLGSDVSRLERSGIDVRVDRTEYHMHHKFAIFDRQLLLTGSYNWTRSAANFNQENVLTTRDPRLARRFQQEFDRLWNDLS